MHAKQRRSLGPGYHSAYSSHTMSDAIPLHPLGGPASAPRDEAQRLVAGRGRFIDSVVFADLAHTAFVRSEVARARLRSIDVAAAAAMPGVLVVFTAAEFAPYIARVPRTRLANLTTHISPPQPPLAAEHVRYQGEPLAMVIASSRALAEDAAAAVTVTYEERTAVASIAAATAEHAPLVGEPRNVAFEASFGAQFSEPENVTRLPLHLSFGRQTGVALETRGIVANYDSVDDELTVHHSHQAPHLVQAVLAELLGMAENRVRVVVGDVGGGFGVKLHIYPDELAVVVAARILGRAVKYTASRSESFLGDCQTREFEASAAIVLDAGGELIGIEADFDNAIGAYSIYPRGSVGDAALCGRLVGTPYRMRGMRATARALWQNKPPAGAIRGVSQPIPCTLTEQLMDVAARHLGEDPAHFRRRHYLGAQDYPHTTHGGLSIECMSLVECLDTLLEAMSYAQLRAEQARLRRNKVLRGIGIASFVELTAPSAAQYAASGAPVTSIDECRIRLEADGSVRVESGATDQGQGTLTGIRQIVAATLGVDFSSVRVRTSDSAGARGGGAWASRGLAIAGEAAALAAWDLKDNILEAAAALLQQPVTSLQLADGHISVAEGAGMRVSELAKIAWYNPHDLPAGTAQGMACSRSYSLEGRPYLVANGVQGSLAEVDPETGVVTLLKHWVVEDCGHVINPALVDGQLIGGVVQGIGAALMECCHYDASGQLLNASLLDYTLPRADNVPPIEVHHVSTPQAGTVLGIKGVGEAGTVGAPAAVWSAVNDALAPLGTRVNAQPITSEQVLRACAGKSWPTRT